MTVLLTVETAVLVVLCILVAGLLRSYATVLQRLHQLDSGVQTGPPPFRTAQGVMPAGEPGGHAERAGSKGWALAHDLAGSGLDGEIISIRTMQTGHDTVLLFLSSGCTGCAAFWEDLAQRREAALVGDGRLVVVTKGPESESVSLLAQLCPPGIDLVMSPQAWEDYSVPGSPYVVVVDGHTGRVKGEGSGTSLGQISGLIRQSRADAAAAVGGQDVPRKPRADAEREVEVDRLLLAAGIAPGHPSLFSTGTNGQSAEPEAHFIGWPGQRSS